jgi:hypothetical protein
MLAWSGDALLAVLIPQASDESITSVYVVANPDKLAFTARQAAGLPRFADLAPGA